MGWCFFRGRGDVHDKLFAIIVCKKEIVLQMSTSLLEYHSAAC